MSRDSRFDPSELFGLRIITVTGAPLGRVIAVIHHRGGCDLLVERRRLLRRAVVRVDLVDLVRVDDRTLRHSPGHLRVAAGSDDWSAA